VALGVAEEEGGSGNGGSGQIGDDAFQGSGAIEQDAESLKRLAALELDSLDFHAEAGRGVSKKGAADFEEVSSGGEVREVEAALGVRRGGSGQGGE